MESCTSWGRGGLCKWQQTEGNPTQCDSVGSVGSEFDSLIPDSLFQAYLRTAQLERKFPGDN